MSAFQRSTPVLGGVEHFVDVAFKEKNPNYRRKFLFCILRFDPINVYMYVSTCSIATEPGDGLLHTFVYQNVYARNPMFGLYIIIGASKF